MAKSRPLSLEERQVLRSLVNQPRMRGLDLVKASGGLLKRVRVYSILSVMEGAGLVASEEEDFTEAGFPVRRVYSITDKGREVHDNGGFP